MKARILDVGCSDKPQGDINVDITLTYKGQLAKIQILADGLHLPFRDNSFILVRSDQVLEHVPNPYQFVEELTRVSKRYVYVSCPNPHDWRVILFDKLDGLAPPGSGHYYQGHSVSELRQMFKCAGLDTITVGFASYEQKRRKLDKFLKFCPRFNKIIVQILGRKQSCV